MSRTEETKGKTLSVPFNKIFIDPKINSRRKLRDIAELARNIDDNGLQSALLVTNGGDAEHPYTLYGGFRRGEALGPKHLDWGSKPVNVIVVDSGPGSNLIENVVREALPALDLAQRLAEMKTGTYYEPGVEEGQCRKWSTAELAKLLSKSQSHIANLVRAHEAITDEVKDLVAPYEPPGRLLFVWSGMKTPQKQLEAAQAWVAYQEELEKAGVRRKGRGKAEGESSNASKKPGKKALQEWVDKFTWKAGSVKGKAAEVYSVAAEVLTFAVGETLRFSPEVWSAEDTKAYKAALKEAETEEEEVEESEEE